MAESIETPKEGKKTAVLTLEQIKKLSNLLDTAGVQISVIEYTGDRLFSLGQGPMPLPSRH